ncbi:MAG: hypothetical protein AUI90_13295 [Deltaproteobacteria bacterium 13_1_40CM_3_69_14]|nr:MAG: hypothetical protein AUI90_13295 [Deltaproteobacteria bacterium 13_1_40CM_3_69_14]
MADGFDSGAEAGDHLGARAGASDRLRYPADVRPDVRQPRRVEVDDAHVLPGEPRDGAANVVQRDRANLAEVLGDDDVGTSIAKALEIDLVDGEGVAQHFADRAVDRPAGRQGPDAGGGQDGQLTDVGWEVAFVGAADQLRSGAEGADDLGSRGEEGGDPHGGTIVQLEE